MNTADFKRHLVYAIGLAALTYAVYIFIYVPTRPFPGFYVFKDQKVQYIRKEKVKEKGIELGVKITGIEGKPITNMLEYIGAISDLEIDKKVDMQFIDREGKVRTASELAAGHTPFPYDALLWCIVALPIFFFGYHIYFKRPWERPVRLFCIVCALTTCAFLGGMHWMSIVSSPVMFSTFVISALILGPVSLHFFLTFPRTKRFFIVRRYIVYLIYLLPVLLVVLLEGLIITASFGVQQERVFTVFIILFPAGLILTVIYFIGCLASIIHSYIVAETNEMKKQIKWILWGASMAALPLIISATYALTDFSSFAVGKVRLLVMVGFLTLLVSYAFSIIKYRLSDVDTFINRSITYFILSGVTIAIYFMILAFFKIFFDVKLEADKITLVLVSVLIIAVVARPILEKGQRIIDRRLYREKYEYQRAITRVSDALVSILDLDELLRTIGDTVTDALQVVHGGIYLYSADEKVFRPAYNRGDLPAGVRGLALSGRSPLVRVMSESRSEVITHPYLKASPLTAGAPPEYMGEVIRLGAEVVIPFIYEGRLLGFMTLGAKKSADFYSSEDVRLLRTMANQAAIAINNASSYKVIERLNNSLNQKIKKIEEQQRRILDLQQQLKDENQYLREEIREKYNFEEIIGSSAEIKNVLQLVQKVARTTSAVLILGESGTGKELIARAIHFNSARKNKPFVKVSCAALAEGVLESELFGHVKGAFTGAVKEKAGRFELADKGTIFLDEIGDISPNTQLKLLRVLQEKEIERVGSSKTIKVDVRILAATNRDLEKLIEQGRFREDLFYRLNVISIYVPPLRNRRDDIYPLTMHFLRKYGAKSGKDIYGVDDETMELLQGYDWPGNIRELENLIERAVVLADGDTLSVNDFPKEIREPGRAAAGAGIAENDGGSLSEALGDIEKEKLKKALEEASGNKSVAARSLGLKRSTFISKLKKYQLA